MNTAAALDERPIDLHHLSRQTLGDRDLEREILALFVRQSAMLSERIRTTMAETDCRDIAHTLKGSARAVGAWRVAEAAEAVENAVIAADPTAGGAAVLASRIRDLALSIDEANGEIAGLAPR